MEEVRLVLLGNAGVGKTSLATRWARNRFDPSYEPTIGVDFLCREMAVSPDEWKQVYKDHKDPKVYLRAPKTVKVMIWDLGGAARLRSIVTSYYRQAQAFILLYDVSDTESYHSLSEWMEEMKQFKPDAPKVIFANKIDQLSEKQGLERTALAETLQGVQIIGTSAKSGSGIEAGVRVALLEALKYQVAHPLHSLSISAGAADGLAKNSCCFLLS